MQPERLTDCLALLVAADAILVESREGVLAAHLSTVIETLRDMQAIESFGTTDDRLGGSDTSGKNRVAPS